jgi:hypothetical protein
MKLFLKILAVVAVCTIFRIIAGLNLGELEWITEFTWGCVAGCIMTSMNHSFFFSKK